MRICFVNLDYLPYRSSGLAVYGETLVAGLAARDHEVEVVTRFRKGLPRQESMGRIRVHRIGRGVGDWVGFAWEAARYVSRREAQQPFDIVHFADVHFAATFRGRFIASLHQSFHQRLTSNEGRPYHTGALDLVWKTTYYWAAQTMAERPALRRADHLISVSQATADEFVIHYCISPERVTVIPTAVDFARLRPRDASALRRRLGLEGARVLLFVGFASARKGLEYLAQALQSLPEDAWLVAVGRWEPKYRARVLKALGPARRRFIEAGYVPDEDLPTYYSMADLFVLPSLLEGFGIPIAEALACGTPVVTTAAGAGAETGGPGAVIVPPRDATALAEAIRRLLESPEERLRLAAEGRAYAQKRYSLEAMISAYEEVYQRFANLAQRQAAHRSVRG